MKPVSRIGQYINNKLPVNYKSERDITVWIYYPEYALASYYASYQQFKSLVIYLANDFLKEFDTLVRAA